MIPSNTICVSQEGPANALALNKDATQVVIAGRNVFKVFAIGETEFSEVCNLRVGKNLNLNFSSIDVAWSSIEENTIATAATNGAVVVWNLGRSGRSKQEHVFSDHKRTVNKVSFHLAEPSLLISGSQDGTMKCFDLRMKEVARTFISNTESIRDVQFSPHQAHTFAAVSENGSVQLWDVRRAERCVVQFTAHSGPVFACDWHPSAPALATASRDKTIKVWDIHAKPTLEHTIYTIASVGHVKWRPHRKYHVASCALVLDCAVHVWDVRRPHVPLATFAEHRDVATAVAWLPSLDAFLSTSRDCSLYRHRFSEAAHPVLWANPQGVCVSARGEVALAVPDRPLPALATVPAPEPERLLPGLGRKQPRAGALTPAAQALLERLFPAGAGSVLRRCLAPAEPLVACATTYRIQGAPPHLLAQHNARVARDNERHMVGHVWDVVSAVYSERAASARRAPAPPPPAAPPPQAEPPPAAALYSAVEEEPMEGVEEWEENQFHNSGVLGLPTHSIYVPPARHARRDDETAGWVSAASAHYVDVEAANWTLPEEAFPLRSAPHPHPPHVPHAHTPPAQDDHPGVAATAGVGGASPAGSASAGSAQAPPPTYTHHAAVTQPDDGSNSGSGSGSEGELSVRTTGAGQPRPDTAPLLAAALKLHAALGDVQTPATVCLALQGHRSVTADTAPLLAAALKLHAALGDVQTPATVCLALQGHRSVTADTAPLLAAALKLHAALGDVQTPATVCLALQGHRSVTADTAPLLAAALKLHAALGDVQTPATVCLALQGHRSVTADTAPLLAAALKLHAALGDVQTPATVCLALQGHRSDLFPYIDEALQEQWLLGYIELLHRHKLWNVATEVIRMAWLGSVRALSQQSTSIAACCGRCARRTRPHQPCDRCHARGRAQAAPDLCAVCHQVVRGLYAWCQGCAHGGHLAHMRRWMETHRLCPAGCGHQCQLG